VPLSVCVPGAAPCRVAIPVSLMDVVATLFEALGLPDPLEDVRARRTATG
jgi:arylsulfatase A-like enzyme